MEEKIKQALDGIKLREELWEDSEYIMTCNGTPVGGTVRRGLQIDRWWGDELKAIIAKCIALKLQETSE